MSDEYAWDVDKTVINYANDEGRLADAAKYVSPGDYDVDIYDGTATNASKTEYDPIANKVHLNSSDYTANGKFDAERFYYASWHEGHHYDMLNMAFQKNAGNIGATNLAEWADKTSNADYGLHRYTQEYINTDPTRIKYYNQMSACTRNDMIKPLTDAARDTRYRPFLKMYESWGY